MLFFLLAALSAPALAELSQVDAQAILLIESQRLPPVALATYLEHPDAQTRARAARALGRLRDTSAVAGLRRLADDAAVDVRREVAFALGQCPGSTAVVVTRLAEETDPQTRAHLVEALGKQGDEQVVVMLLDALVTPNRGLRPSLEPAAAARALGRLSLRDVDAVRTPLVAERLLAQLRRGDRGTRQAAAFALGRLSLTTLEAPTRDHLLAAARDDWDPVVRAFLVRAAGHLDLSESEAGLLFGVTSTDHAAAVRIATVRAAASHAWPGVTGLLDDPNRGVRREAIAAVGRVDSLEIADLLQPLIDQGSTIEAAEALRIDGDPRLLEAAIAIEVLASQGRLLRLDDYLDHARPTRIRAAAVGAVSSIDRLVSLATEDGEGQVRTAAAVRLTELSDEPTQVVPLLDAFDPIVAAIAAEHLTTHPAPGIEDQLVTALMETDNPDLMRAAAEALAARYQGHPNPPLKKDAELQDSLTTLSNHADASVRGAIADLQAALGLPVTAALHHVRNVPLDQVERIQGARIITSRGEVRIDLLPEDAPLTVWNFAGLADQGFYDNLTIHRVVPDFVVQDGDPRGDGYGGPGWTIPDEINPVSYDTGVVGMALSGPDTGGSQWFVTLSPQPHLDGDYTAFGRVTYGMGLLQTLQPGDRIEEVIIERAEDPES